MKIAKLSWILLLFLAAGCIYSHRQPGVVYESVTPTVTVPTSERPVTRVYTETPATVVAPTVIAEPATPTTTVASTDLAMADNIRKMLLADPALSSAARNVRIAVFDGRVTMTGTVVTVHDREILHSALSTMPGVTRLDDQVQVDLQR